MSTGELTRLVSVRRSSHPSLSVRFHPATDYLGARFSVGYLAPMSGKRNARMTFGYDYSLDAEQQITAHVAAWLLHQGHEWYASEWIISRAGETYWVAVAIPEAVAK
jgi:hypothetical protein